MKFWTRENCWEHVKIDLDGMHEAMLARTNTDERGVEPNKFDDWVRRRLEAIVERLRPLIDNAARSNVKLKGWNEDRILKVLEIKEGQGQSPIFPHIVIMRRFLKGFGNSNGCLHWFAIRLLHPTKISNALHRLFLQEATRFGEHLSAVSSHVPGRNTEVRN